MKTGWSRADIMALHPSEFFHYLDILTAEPKPDHGKP
jgi:hypothetical protein